MATAVESQPTDFAPVPLKGLAGSRLVEFPLYLSSGHGRFVLYQPSQREFDGRHEDRLIAEGVEHLYIREDDRRCYSRRIESDLPAVLRDRSIQLPTRVAILTGVADEVAEDVFAAVPDKAEVKRVQQVMAATAALVVRDPQAFNAIREVLTPGTALHQHSMTVGMLSIGLANRVISGDPDSLMTAGTAGLLHDVGRVGHDPTDADQNHTSRGYHLLRGLGLPRAVCDVALFHHERADGSGFPDGIGNDEIPPLARLVGLVDTFHRVYAEGDSSGGVYNALRVMAQVYRGCFDPQMVAAFLKLFGQ